MRKRMPRNAHCGEFALYLHQQGHVLLDGEPADISKDEGAILAAHPPGWSEKLCIDATLHQVTGFPGAAFQHLAQLLVGRIEHFCQLVEAHDCRQRAGLHAGLQLRGDLQGQ